MRAMLIVVITGMLCLPAMAINRYNISKMSCARVQSIVTSQGAAILRYPSKRKPSLVLYDRYVRDSGYCEPGDYAKPAFVPTADNPQCRVRNCKSFDYDDIWPQNRF